MADPNLPDHTSLTTPALDLVAITPHDSTAFTRPLRCIYVGTTGNVKLRTTSGTTVTFSNVPAGAHIGPFRVDLVYNTDTTASNLVGYV